MQLGFYVPAVIAIISSILVITRVNAVHALLYLIVSLFSVAVVFFTLGSPFAAALEIIIYAGAIMVLFIFAVMLLNLGKEADVEEKRLLNFKLWIGPGILSLILLIQLLVILLSNNTSGIEMQIITPKEVGISLFHKYLLGVELSGMLLMSGIVGAFTWEKKKKSGIDFCKEKTSEPGYFETAWRWQAYYSLSD
jgi:NADH-quinone oxidoreductase subunit J